MYQIKTEDAYEGFSSHKEISKYYDNSNKLVTGKMKDETGDTAIEESVGLKPKIFSFLGDNSQHKKQKVWIKMLLEQ